MDELIAVPFGLIVNPIVSYLRGRYGWNSKQAHIVAIIFAVLAGIIAEFLSGDTNFDDYGEVTKKIASAFITSQIFYTLAWKKSTPDVELKEAGQN